MQNSIYFVVTKAFPVNFVWADKGRKLASQPAFPVRVEAFAEELLFSTQQLESFTFNDLSALQAECEVVHPGTGQVCGLMFQLLPVGTLILHSVHRVPSQAELPCSDSLKEFGTEHYRADDCWTAVAYQVLEQLEALGVISYCEVAPFDILRRRNDPKEPDRIDQATFCREMAWRAWASGSYATLAETAGNSDTDWRVRSELPERAALPTRRGEIWTLWPNYFGWNLRLLPEDAGQSHLSVLVRELEPVSYMISRRSQCASGFHNVRKLARLLISRGYDGFDTHDMRLYLGSIRLALLAPKEYEGSTAMTSRRIYRQACDDLEIEHHTQDFYDGINALVEDIKGVNADREQKAEKRLNRIAVFLSVALSLSLVIDIVEFLLGDSPSFSFQDRMATVTAGGASLLLLLIVMWLIARRR